MAIFVGTPSYDGRLHHGTCTRCWARPTPCATAASRLQPPGVLPAHGPSGCGTPPLRAEHWAPRPFSGPNWRPISASAALGAQGQSFLTHSAASEEEVDVRQRLHAVELDLELGGGVRVVAAADDRVAARGEVAHLAWWPVNAVVPTQWKAWLRGIVVSASMPMRSILSTRWSKSVITSRVVRRSAALGHGIEVVEVAAAAARAGVLAEPALEAVVELRRP